MNVLHVSTPSNWRGGEQQVAYLTSGLHIIGIRQVALCPEGSALATRLMEEGIAVATFTSRGFLGLKLSSRIAALCNKGNFTHIHCHDSHAHTAAVIATKLIKREISIIVSRRVAFPVSRNMLSRWKYNHPAVKQIICVSQVVKQITLPSIADDTKVCVIYDGIDIEKYKQKPVERILITELGFEKDTILIGNLSALSKTKDFPTFLKVAKRICSAVPKARFVIAGEGPEKNKIQKTIKDLKLEDRVYLLGFRTDVEVVMQSLDIFLFTSIIEGLGTIVLEAFAAGVAVITTRAGGIPELVEDQQTGLLAEPGDIDTLTAAVLHFIKHPLERKKLADRAKDHVLQFTYQETAMKTAAIYRQYL